MALGCALKSPPCQPHRALKITGQVSDCRVPAPGQRSAHGSKDMPIWGPIFKMGVRKQGQSVEYLTSIQAKQKPIATAPFCAAGSKPCVPEAHGTKSLPWLPAARWQLHSPCRSLRWDQREAFTAGHIPKTTDADGVRSPPPPGDGGNRLGRLA
jgi:hypothetical protein